MSFFDGFEDELTKLAQTPYGGRPPEISRRKATAGSFDWQGFDKKFQSESAAARRRDDYKRKGGLSLLPPKRNPYEHKPPPSDAPEEAKKKGRGRGGRKPTPPTPVPSAATLGTDEEKLKRVESVKARYRGPATQASLSGGYKSQYGTALKSKPAPGSPGIRAVQNPKALLPWKQKTKTVKPTSAPTTQGEQTYLP